MELSAGAALDEVRRVEEEVRKTRRAYSTILLVMGLATGPYWWGMLLGPDWAGVVAGAGWIALVIWMLVLPRRPGLRGRVNAPWVTRLTLLGGVTFLAPMLVATGLKIAGVETTNWLVAVLCLISGLPMIYAGWRLRRSL
ncbi:hypothetical protein FDA94_32770 [Herbidospora galbida]|uniref:Uncharacterized protein n=1 Tax=Herbidospora galbida TaxID=2575442 RepID=A0A4U3M4L2_9ACTN|nr:hypothetical protein [Herbidospora galbida]TKK83755.1 hypothetical protein FDA94_32770 [Herbidospora galbida]